MASSAPVKVVHLFGSDNSWGLAYFASQLAREMVPLGVESVIAAPKGSWLLDSASGLGIESVECSFKASYNPLQWSRLASFIKQTGANVVHAHTAPAIHMAAQAVLLMARCGKVATWLQAGVCGSARLQLAKADIVSCLSALVEREFPPAVKPRLGLRTVEAGVNVAAYAELAGKRTEKRAELRETLCPDKNKPLFIANFAAYASDSNQKTLLEAMPHILTRLPQTHLILMGEGPLAAELRQTIRITALENDVSFLAPDPALADVMNAADLYVTLNDNDAVGFMAREAMAAGRAIVARDSGCHAELIDNDKYGIVCRAESGEELAHAILGLLENRTRREHCGRLAAARAAKQFNILNTAEQMKAIYQETLA